jgi:hypothetical protein
MPIQKKYSAVAPRSEPPSLKAGRALVEELRERIHRQLTAPDQ